MAYAFNPITGKLDLVGTGGGSATTDASLLTSGTLADARLSSNVSLDNINNNFTSGQTITAPANTSALTASYSVTGANTTPLVNLTGTWNTTGVARGILLNVTDTASASTSALMDLGVGSRTQYAFTKSRQFWLYNSSPATQDASNFERGFMRWNSNVLEIGTEAGGTGAGRALSLSASSGNVTINPAAGSTCIVQSPASPSLSVGISGESLARARLQIDAVAFGAGASSARDMFLMRNSSTLFEINNGTAGTVRDLKLRNVIQASGVATTVTPSSNGDLVIEQTANTTLTFKMRGTDGTVRSATLTLA